MITPEESVQESPIASVLLGCATWVAAASPFFALDIVVQLASKAGAPDQVIEDAIFRVGLWDVFLAAFWASLHMGVLLLVVGPVVVYGFRVVRRWTERRNAAALRSLESTLEQSPEPEREDPLRGSVPPPG